MEGKCPHCGYEPGREQVVHVEIKNAEISAYGAYLTPSAREGKAQVVMDFELIYKTAFHCEEEPANIASEIATHELLHALQDLLGRAFSESDVERLIAAANGVEVSEEDMESRDHLGAILSDYQTAIEACEIALRIMTSQPTKLEDWADGITALRAAIAKAKGEQQ